MHAEYGVGSPFSLDLVRALLSLADNQDRACAAINALAGQHLAAVYRKIADLGALRYKLGRLIGQCGTAVSECRII